MAHTQESDTLLEPYDETQRSLGQVGLLGLKREDQIMSRDAQVTTKKKRDAQVVKWDLKSSYSYWPKKKSSYSLDQKKKGSYSNVLH